MGVRDFFKSTKGKIISVLVINLIYIFAFSLLALKVGSSSFFIFNLISHILFLPALLIYMLSIPLHMIFNVFSDSFFANNICGDFIGYPCTFMGWVSSVFAVTITWYLVVCVFVWARNKIRNR